MSFIPDRDVNGNYIIGIKEEDPNKATGGHYQSCVGEVDVQAGDTTKTLDISFPIPVALLSASFQQHSDLEGDSVEFQVAPNTVIGTLTASVAVNDTELSVSQTVIDNAQVGYFIKIDSEDFGRVISIDKDNNKITIENAATTTHSSGAYVLQTVKMLIKSPLDKAGPVILGESKIGGSYIPANTILRTIYYNDLNTAKKFRFYLEYLY